MSWGSDDDRPHPARLRPVPPASRRPRAAGHAPGEVDAMTLYFCPTAGEVEDSEHGGFDVCCERPDLHREPTSVELALLVLSSHRIGAFNGTQTACYACNRWMANAEYRSHLAEKLADSNLLAPAGEVDSASLYYAVIHENDIGRGPEFGVASSVHTVKERAENALGYCLALQEAGRPGTEGRYFIVEMREVTP